MKKVWTVWSEDMYHSIKPHVFETEKEARDFVAICDVSSSFVNVAQLPVIDKGFEVKKLFYVSVYFYYDNNKVNYSVEIINSNNVETRLEEFRRQIIPVVLLDYLSVSVNIPIQSDKFDEEALINRYTEDIRRYHIAEDIETVLNMRRKGNKRLPDDMYEENIEDLLSTSFPVYAEGEIL